MKHLVIEPSSDKGRSFSAIPLAMAAADQLWEGGRANTDVCRPIWLMVAGSENELRPFMANLRLGKKAVVRAHGGHQSRRDSKLELLRSAEYQFAWQRMAEGSVVTAFQPDLFRLDPGMVDPTGVRFCILAPKTWIDSQEFDARAAIAHVRRVSKRLSEATLARILPVACLFAAYLDRRTRCPLVNDQRFYLQLFFAAVNAEIASFSSPFGYHNEEKKWGHHSTSQFQTEGLADVGIESAVICNATHEAIEELLSEQAAIYFRSIQ